MRKLVMFVLFGSLGSAWVARDAPALAAAPNGRYRLTDDVVEDAATGLRWQRHAPTDRYDWTHADAYCTALSLEGKGWRLPTIKELYTLVDETRVMPALDSDAFPGADADYYWSSSQLAEYPMNAWLLELGTGVDVWLGVATEQRVRCVR